MPSPAYLKQKPYIMAYYEKNKRDNWDRSNARRRFLTEAKRFRNMLLLDIEPDPDPRN